MQVAEQQLLDLRPKFKETRKKLLSARHLPGEVYSSPEIYDMEKQQIFMKYWLSVGRVEEIPTVGDYYTFRPSVQYAFIGDGWDLGGRAVMSFNTRNKDTGYYSGKIFNFDWQAMAFVSEDIRVGVQGYFVRQLQADTVNSTPANGMTQKMLVDQQGNKASVNAIGPAVAWLMNGGEMLIEGKFIKEFGAKNRTEGQAFWLTISKPL